VGAADGHAGDLGHRAGRVAQQVVAEHHHRVQDVVERVLQVVGHCVGEVVQIGHLSLVGLQRLHVLAGIAQDEHLPAILGRSERGAGGLHRARSAGEGREQRLPAGNAGRRLQPQLRQRQARQSVRGAAAQGGRRSVGQQDAPPGDNKNGVGCLLKDGPVQVGVRGGRGGRFERAGGAGRRLVGMVSRHDQAPPVVSIQLALRMTIVDMPRSGKCADQASASRPALEPAHGWHGSPSLLTPLLPRSSAAGFPHR